MTPTRSNAEPCCSSKKTPAVASRASPRAEKTRVASKAQAASASEAPRRRNCRKPNAARDKRSARQGACDGPGGEGYGREPPGPGTDASAPQQALVQAGKGHERESFDGDPHQQPSDVEVRELAGRPRQLAALAAHGPERDASERDAHDEPDETPRPPAPQVRGRLPGRELAQARSYS